MNLKQILYLNGTFSLTTGMLILIFQSSLYHLFELEIEWVYQGLGIGLIGFAFVVFHQARKLQYPGIRIIVFMDLMWVLSSILILVLYHDMISTSGINLIVLVGIFVSYFGVGQYRGLIKMIHS